MRAKSEVWCPLEDALNDYDEINRMLYERSDELEELGIYEEEDDKYQELLEEELDTRRRIKDLYEDLGRLLDEDEEDYLYDNEKIQHIVDMTI